MPKKTIYIIIGAIAAIGIIIYFGLQRGPGTPAQKIELEFWSVFDSSDVYGGLIASFNEKYPNIKINYRKLTYDEYEETLINAFANGRGPDIFSIHNTWLPKHIQRIYPIPPSMIDLKKFYDTYVDVVPQDFLRGGRVYGIPYYVDTLALYFNRDFFNTAGIVYPPKTWKEFLDTVEILTRRDEQGNIIRAGAALGTARNINRSTDILGLLMLQSGTRMTNEEHTEATFDHAVSLDGESYYAGQKALQFYTDFANPSKRVYTWNSKMHYSIDAFVQGDAAMMINYSHHIGTIRAKAPYLNFDIAPVPQIEGAEVEVNYPNYWAQVVSRRCRYPEAAWSFILFIAERDNVKQYLQTVRKPTARKDLIAWQKGDFDLEPFVDQVLTARSWYQVDNVAIESILANMIESVVEGRASYGDAIRLAADQVSVLMK